MDKMLQRARLLVLAAFILPIGIILGVTADLHLRANRQDRDALRWMQALDLSSPAFWPAGTLQRHPQSLPPAVDVRMSPVFDWDRDGRLRPSPQW